MAEMGRYRLAIAAAASALWALAAGPRPAAAMKAQAAVPNAAAVRADSPAAPAAPAAPPAKAVPLVCVDEELVAALNQADTYLREGRYDEAIAVLQALIQRPDSGFYRSADGRRFTSLGRRAVEMIGQMDAKGLKLYRALYDPQAQELYKEAMASADPAGRLRALCERYLHTACGPQALEALGATYFDRGAFSQAATAWRQLLDGLPKADVPASEAPMPVPAPDRAMLLAKIAAAHHLAGESAAAARAAEELTRSHPDASGTIGGRMQKLSEFVESVRRRPPPAAAARQERSGWPGLGGAPDGLAVMADCDIVLDPRWRRLGGAGSTAAPLDEKNPPRDVDAAEMGLMAGAEMYLNGLAARGTVRPILKLQNGHVQMQIRSQLPVAVEGRGSASGEMLMPALVQPVIADGKVFVRADDCVRAYDLLTGEFLCRSVDSFPMVAEARPEPRSGIGGAVFYSGGYSFLGDAGRYALTVGGDKVFTVCGFPPFGGNLVDRMAVIRRLTDSLAGGSCLAALSIPAELSVKWHIGNGKGDHDVIRIGRFLTAPTYRAGRLYIPILHLDTYYLACLDAESGSLIWQAKVAQTPAPSASYVPFRGSDPRLSIGSPPAVADGRVFITTNAGVIAAYEEETGQPVWAYQYAGPTERLSARGMRFGFPYAVSSGAPPNPILVLRGKVICLPADSADVIALRSADGALEWTESRRDQNDLSAIDEDRILLSGRSLYVLKVADGSTAYAHRDAGSLAVHGRPAVTARAVLASGRGRLHRLDLKSYEVSEMALTGEGILGNLVSAEGKLLAANAMGFCAYFDYDVARAELARRIESTVPPQRSRLLAQRAELALSASRPKEALADVEACQNLPDAEKDSGVVPLLPRLFLRTYVSLGNRAGAPQPMRESFLKAQTHAQTDQEKAHMLLRLAKCAEDAGNYPGAVALAQELGEKYGKEDLVDVRIGPGGDDGGPIPPDRPTVRGERLAGDFIRGMVEKYGRTCYADFDALAEKALAQARQAGDAEALVTVARRWPVSQWADDALFAAAELLYQRFLAEPDRAGEAFEQCQRHLHRVAAARDSPLRVSAAVGLAVIYARGGWTTSAANECSRLHELPADTPVTFGDVKGTLGELLKLIEGGRLPAPPKPVRVLSRIHPPLRPVFSIAGDNVWVLRDQEGRPVRLDEKVAILKGGDVYLLDATAEDPNKALEGWKGLTGLASEKAAGAAGVVSPAKWCGGLSRDGKVLAAADNDAICGLSVATARLTWQKKAADLGLATPMLVGMGQDAVVAVDQSGRVVCLDIRDGRLLWRGNLVGGTRQPVGAPQIRGDLVVLCHNLGRTVTCLSLSRDGRAVGNWAAQQWTQFALTEGGLLALMVDGELTVRDPSRLDKPLWRAAYDASQGATLLGASGELVAVAAQMGGAIDLLSVEGGRKVATLQPEPLEGTPAAAAEVQFADGEVYVVLHVGSIPVRRGGLVRIGTGYGLGVQKFRIADDKLAWSRMLDAGGTHYLGPAMVARSAEHVVAVARQYQPGVPCPLYILDAATGKDAQPRIELPAGGAAAQGAQIRRQLIGRPVMASGRLIVETPEGLTVYGEK